MNLHSLLSHLHVLPTTRSGWIALALAVASFVTFAVYFRLAETGTTPWLMPVVGWATAFVAAASAIVGIARQHERSLLLVLPILWGIVWAMFWAGEFTNPH